jgi:hypothetical protein
LTEIAFYWLREQAADGARSPVSFRGALRREHVWGGSSASAQNPWLDLVQRRLPESGSYVGCGAVSGGKGAQLETIAEEIRDLTESPLWAYRDEQGHLPVVGEERVPIHLRRLVNVESGLDDGLGLPVVLFLLHRPGAS